MPVEVKREPPLSRHVAEARLRANSPTALWGMSCKYEEGVFVDRANVEGAEPVVNQIEVAGRAI